MKQTLLMVPIGSNVGLTTVTIGLMRAFENRGLKTCLLSPIKEQNSTKSEKSLSIQFVESLLSRGEKERFLEHLIAYFELHAKGVHVVLVRGAVSTQLRSYAPQINIDMARSLDAKVVFVMTPGNSDLEVICKQIEIAAEPYGGVKNPNILGVIFNKVGAPIDRDGKVRMDLFDPLEKVENKHAIFEKWPLFKRKDFQLIGCFPWERSLMALRVQDIQKHLKAQVVSEGYMKERVMHFAIASATVEYAAKILNAETMVLTSGDRSDIIVATCLAYLSGTTIAALLLTGGYLPGVHTLHLCKSAMEQGLPILSVETDTLRTAVSLQTLSMDIPEDDLERREMVQTFASQFIDEKWIKQLGKTHQERYLSPSAFRFELIEKAKKKRAKIVLPEGEDIRILKAAKICAKRKIAQIILLGNKNKMERLIKEHEIPLEKGIEFLDPKDNLDRYVKPLAQLRAHKGVNEKKAREYLDDPITLGTMMLQMGHVDGLVGGATHTTAHTLLPAFKLIKTKPSIQLVSSVFFMCLPTQVLVYADCAVNQNPSARELADIAIQSSKSAKQFGIPPRVAMISYSTGESGKGVDVEKVKQAIKWVKEKEPDLLIDGPLQYDAAFALEVAKKKAPDSPVAGKATVYIFPDLNTANTTYKAVQRSANVLSIGPILQGLNKPVNDLSRGATVDDIVFTIALTAIQVES